MGSTQHLAASRRNVARRPPGGEIGGGRSPAPKFLALGLGPFQLALKAQALRLTLGLRPWHSKDGEPIEHRAGPLRAAGRRGELDQVDDGGGGRGEGGGGGGGRGGG